MSVGLVLEGGGMRGVYTGGVLHYFMEQNFYIPYVIGVSAGACQGSSYVSKQIERNKAVTIDYVSHPEYISLKNLIQKGELFGMDFIFHDLPIHLVPFDFQTFYENEQKFVIGVTDCETGQPLYFEKSDLRKKADLLAITRASSSLPYMARKVEFQGKFLLDGGIADPIPIRKSEQDGNKKNVVILTQNKGYRKGKSRSGNLFVKATNRQQGEFAQCMIRRNQMYNETLDYLEEQERFGNVFIIRPEEPLEVGRVERDKEKLTALYEQGYRQAENQFLRLKNWLEQ